MERCLACEAVGTGLNRHMIPLSVQRPIVPTLFAPKGIENSVLGFNPGFRFHVRRALLVRRSFVKWGRKGEKGAEFGALNLPGKRGTHLRSSLRSFLLESGLSLGTLTAHW